MVNIQINGGRQDVRAAEVAGLMAELGLDPRTVLVEHNGRALHRREWPQVALAADDRIEILRVVAGG
ncbi:MAG TPA: sulfur carrier protein ThiS [Chthoniobacterales bacterium]